MEFRPTKTDQLQVVKFPNGAAARAVLHCGANA